MEITKENPESALSILEHNIICRGSRVTSSVYMYRPLLWCVAFDNVWRKLDILFRPKKEDILFSCYKFPPFFSPFKLLLFIWYLCLKWYKEQAGDKHFVQLAVNRTLLYFAVSPGFFSICCASTKHFSGNKIGVQIDPTTFLCTQLYQT